jgi:hypothetical protein
MSRKLLLPLALVGATAMGVFAATGIGTADSDEPAGHAETTIDVRVSGDAGAVPAGVGAHTSSKAKVTYRRGNVQPVPGATSTGIDIRNCPKKTKVVNGTVATSRFGVVPAESFQLRTRGWHITLDDLTNDTNPYEARFGLVCVGNKK